MKAVYTTARGKVFRINQNPSVPSVLSEIHVGAHAKVEEDPRARVAKEIFCVSALDVPNTLSNREMYVNLCKYLKDHKVTHIDVIQNNFKVMIEYTSCYNGKPLGTSTVTRGVVPIEALVALGTATNNENVFRRVKEFKENIEFTIGDSVPYGITDSSPKKFLMHINNICIFQDFNPTESHPHQSAYCTPYGYNDFTTFENLQNMQLVYSTQGAGIKFDTIELSYIPRKIILGVDILLSNYIDVYDSTEIDRIIDDNIHEKYIDHPVVPDDTDYPQHMIPTKDHHPWADGDNYPRGRDKTYEYYRRTNSTNPNALLVVENNMGDDIYDVYTMVHQKKVIRDIPDIQVGEYVRIESGFLISDRRPPRPPRPPRPHHRPHRRFWDENDNADTPDDGYDDDYSDDPTEDYGDNDGNGYGFASDEDDNG